MASEDSEIHVIRTEIASVKGDVATVKAMFASQADQISRFDSWLQRISEDMRKKSPPNTMPVYVALITGVSVLLALGQFALAPVQHNVEELKQHIEAIRHHDSDGHPEMVMQRIDVLDITHRRDTDHNAAANLRDESRLDDVETRVSVLETVAEERTERFIRTLQQRDRISEMRSEDRLTGSEHRIHEQSIEQRLQRLEGVPGRGGRGERGRHGGDE